MKQEFGWAEKNSRVSSLCFQQRTCSNLPQQMRAEAHRDNYVLWCFYNRDNRQVSLENADYMAVWPLSAPPSAPKPSMALPRLPWATGYAQMRTTGSNTQVPESTICLIIFERRVLNVLQGRWSEWGNNPSHWGAWIINLDSGLGGFGLQLNSAAPAQPDEMKWNWNYLISSYLISTAHGHRRCPSSALREPSQLFKEHSFNILERKQLLACRVISPVHLRI